MNIRFQFMKYRKIAGIASLIIFTISVFSLAFRGLSLGLDFSGGTLVEVSYETPVELESIRNTLIENGYEDSQVVNFGTNLDVLIKVADQNGNSSIGEAVYTLLNEQGFKGELKRVEFVGPQVGAELRDQGGLGMLVALFMILMYVAFRFRENFSTQRELEPMEIIDPSLNQTLGRTVVTSLTTLLVLFALFIFGGEMIKGFSLALILGVLVGTYSSIYVVANMLMSLTLIQEDLAIPEPEGAEFDELP